MAITSTYINNDKKVLKTFLQQLVPEYFARVEDLSETGVAGDIYIRDADDNLLLRLQLNYSPNRIYVYFDETHYVQVEWSGVVWDYGYIAEKGAMISAKISNQGYFGTLLITKTNNGKTAFVFSAGINNSTAHCLTYLHALAWGDDPSTTSADYNQITRTTKKQTMIVPFLTNPIIGVSSYTPNAGYFLTIQSTIGNAAYGTVIIDGVTYLTNGYWAIKDA